MSSRIDWKERWPREGWDVQYTVLGARLDPDPLVYLDNSLKAVAARATSQAFVAAPSGVKNPPEVVLHWATVVRKILQRGIRPVTFHESAAKLGQVRDPHQFQLIASLCGHTHSFELDPAVELHPIHERPFWDRLAEVAPELQRWCTPQASLEGLAGRPWDGTRRWVDFLFYVPWRDSPLVVEVDGSGHERAKGVDRERDRLLNASRVRTKRLQGADVRNPNSSWFSRLDSPSWLGLVDPTIALAIHGPPALNRLAYAIVEGVERGLLPAGHPWVIDVVDETGAVSRAGEIALDILSLVADVWNCSVVPEDVILSGVRYGRSDDRRFRRKAEVEGPPPQLRVLLEPFQPPNAPLPSGGDIPTIVIRGALLPVEFAWSNSTFPCRVNRGGTPAAAAALDCLLKDLFGHESFREGQKEAIGRVLSGGDACVLLPTGGGKTLIYQIAGLLRPGATLVVAPLKSLIDDQERRLLEAGIDRVQALHSGKGLERREKHLIHRSIGAGEATFVLVAPERLQIREFREHLVAAAQQHLINLAVIDEVHCVSEWGHDFRPSYLNLGRNLRRFCKDSSGSPPPLLALTATASPHVLEDVFDTLELDRKDQGTLHRPASFDRPNLHYRVFSGVPGSREVRVQEALHWVAESLYADSNSLFQLCGDATKSGVVFVPDASSGRKLGLTAYRDLIRRAFSELNEDSTALYSGSKPKELDGQSFREWEHFKAREAEAFRTNGKPIMVATSAFGMGIDKPNIRYTIHVALPSSIEAFAQQAGRAGRDNKPAYCALVGSWTERDSILLQNPRQGGSRRTQTDVELEIERFLTAFPDSREELRVTLEVYEELKESGTPGQEVVIPRARSTGVERRKREREERDRERALYRMIVAGVVEDYTIEYGAGAFSVQLASASTGEMVDRTKRFAERATGRNLSILSRVEDLRHQENRDGVVKGLMEILIDVIYDNIGPARLRALRELISLAGLGSEGESIRTRINAYLGEGLVSVILEKLVNGEISIRGAVADLSQATPAHDEEWAGSAARFLEAYPDHPVIIGMRALGEAWRSEGSEEDFRSLVMKMTRRLPDYASDAKEQQSVILWLLSQVRGQGNLARRSWAVHVWEACTLLPESVMVPVEDLLLSEDRDHGLHSGELAIVLERRMTRMLQGLQGLFTFLPRAN